ncbi:MAG: regulatory protein RecX [Cellvibrionaceae bacterium]
MARQKRAVDPAAVDPAKEVRKPTIAAVRYAAMSLLARREHCRLELRQKLARRFSDHAELIDTVVQNLADEALQSDSRFVEAFVSMRKRKGQGPIRITNELKLRGIDETLTHCYLDPNDEQWISIAHSVCLRKYGALASKAGPRAKQMRFLQYRGFSTEQIHKVWKEFA